MNPDWFPSIPKFENKRTQNQTANTGKSMKQYEQQSVRTWLNLVLQESIAYATLRTSGYCFL